MGNTHTFKDERQSLSPHFKHTIFHTFTCKGTYCSGKEKKSSSIFSGLYYLFNHFIHAKWTLLPPFPYTKQIKTTVSSFRGQGKYGLFEYFKTGSKPTFWSIETANTHSLTSSRFSSWKQHAPWRQNMLSRVVNKNWCYTESEKG